MDLKEKVTSSPHICGIELDFDGALAPSYRADFLKFYNSFLSNNDFQEIYFGLKTVRFRESSSNTRSGYYYTPKLTIKFPSNDANRAFRIDLFTKVKFVKIKFNNGKSLVIGRNDYFQNKRPNVKIDSDDKMTTVRFSCKSISPSGFVDVNYEDIGFPTDCPIDFNNMS